MNFPALRPVQMGVHMSNKRQAAVHCDAFTFCRNYLDKYSIYFYRHCLLYAIFVWTVSGWFEFYINACTLPCSTLFTSKDSCFVSFLVSAAKEMRNANKRLLLTTQPVPMNVPFSWAVLFICLLNIFNLDMSIREFTRELWNLRNLLIYWLPSAGETL